MGKFWLGEMSKTVQSMNVHLLENKWDFIISIDLSTDNLDPYCYSYV